MKPAQLREVRYDVERIRKAADRMDELEMDYMDVMAKLKHAEQSLKIIATWAHCGRSDDDLKMIENRAMDTLVLIKDEA